MKKVFIGLLIVAAGVGTFYFLQEKNSSSNNNNNQHENIIGKWKLDSIQALNDSVNKFMSGIIGIIEPDLKKYSYEFKKDGAILISEVDSLATDSSRYQWNKNNQLTWLEYPADTMGEVFSVSLLNKKSLALLSADSVVLLFSRVK